MKKASKVMLFSIVILVISSLIAYILKYAEITNKWEPFCVGVGVLLFSGILALIAKKWYFLNYVCFAFSGVGLGLLIRAWYVFRGFENNLFIMIAVSLVASLYVVIYRVLAYIKFLHKHPVLFTFLYLFLTLVGYILLVIYTKTTFVSTFGYYMIIEVAFLFALTRKSYDNKTLFRNIVLSTYSIFVVALIMLIIFIGGDGLDGFDIDIGGIDIDFDFGDGTRKNKSNDIIEKGDL